MSSLAKIGIISIGDMGMGIAKLLIANGFSVATNCKGRSNDTLERAKTAQVELLKSDEDLAARCSVILSVVPPRDAAATAQRIVDALTSPSFQRQDSGSGNDGGAVPLYFADLNAVAPSTTKSIAALFEKASSRTAGAQVRFVDGGIIGGPPSLKPRPTTVSTEAAPDASRQTAEWTVPSIPTSGPHKISDIPGYGDRLASTLRMRHISPEVGAASGLKMCFASLSKGFTSLAIQSFTTAHGLGVLDELQREVEAFMPAQWRAAERGVVGMAPKAYRWVREMEEIALTFSEEGGFAGDHSSFRAAAEVYRSVAEDTELGKERVGSRKRGLDVADVAAAMAEGMATKRKKTD